MKVYGLANIDEIIGNVNEAEVECFRRIPVQNSNFSVLQSETRCSNFDDVLITYMKRGSKIQL